MKRRGIKTKGMLALLLTCGMLAGCGAAGNEKQNVESGEGKGSSEADSADSASQEQEASAETVNITWHRTAWHTNADEKMVEAAINEYIEPLIGVTVTIMNSDENTALDLALAAGDDIDLFWTASWDKANNFIDGNVPYDITDIVKQYPDLYASMPESIWEAAKRNGRNLYVPIYKEAAEGSGLTVPSAMVKKYGWNLSEISELKDIEPMLAELKADGVEYPIVIMNFYYPIAGRDDYAFITKYAGIKRDGDHAQVVNIMESPEYAEHLALMHSWFEKGYINSVEATTFLTEAQVIEFRNAGENGFFRWDMVPDSEGNATARFAMDMDVVQLTDVYAETDSPAGSLYMINGKTEKIDAVLKFLQILYTDEKVANLAAFGIEGVHYNMTEDGRVTLIGDSGYSYPGVWIVTNVNAPTLLDTEAADKKEQYDEFNKSAKVSVTAGFRFDKTAVEAEMDAIDAVFAEYEELMDRGAYDPEIYLPKYQEALKKAGIDRVIEEIQAQWDAFRAAQ